MHWSSKPLRSNAKRSAGNGAETRNTCFQTYSAKRRLFSTAAGPGRSSACGATAMASATRRGSYNFGWHAFRHFYGTELALAGYDIHLIQMELGHASADMSMVYVNQRLRLRKKALLENGSGQFITIRGEVDNKIAELAMRKDAALTVDVPGGLCSLPG
jgi:integrase